MELEELDLFISFNFGDEDFVDFVVKLELEVGDCLLAELSLSELETTALRAKI